MAADPTIRSYVSLEATEELRDISARRDKQSVGHYLSRLLFDQDTPPPDAVCTVLHIPSFKQLEAIADEKLVVALDTDRNTWERVRSVAADPERPELPGAGDDLPVYSTRHWCPATGGGPIFADRAAAERLIGVEALRRADPPVTGRGVNVVLLDHGLDKRKVPNFGGGWSGGLAVPGATEGGHGMEMVRNILSIAPDVTIFDYPVLPPRITNLPSFLHLIDAAYEHLIRYVAAQRSSGYRAGPWVVVNAWSVYDLKTESPAGFYSNGPLHHLNEQIDLVADANIDMVFAAGNCGQFCPDPRCGDRDRGPGASIIGANSHPRVLTVSAVRSDALWLGYSSQGPGQSNLEVDKPDICAPSEFRETHDAAVTNTGTSTACALAAGVVAALRSRWPETAMSPDELRKLLVKTARKIERADWSPRTGHGVLDAAAALEAALRNYPGASQAEAAVVAG